jgi:hypothetical protein
MHHPATVGAFINQFFGLDDDTVGDKKQENGGGFSIMKPLEKVTVTLAGGYYAATYIPDDQGL